MGIIKTKLPSGSGLIKNSLIDQICDKLTDFILKGDLEGGEQLKEDELRKFFQVSRSPIREALRELEKRGLIVIRPRRGAFVKKVTMKDIEQNFITRSVLEGLAARQAHTGMSDEERNSLEHTLKEMETAAEERDKNQFINCITQFHKIFIKGSGNSVVINSLKNIPVHVSWERFMVAYTDKEMKNSVRDHREMLKVFQHRQADPTTIENIVRKHLETSIQRLRMHFEKLDIFDP